MQLIKENIQPLADDLMSYCQKHLGYKSNPSLHFQEDEQNSMNPLGRTAHYSPDENKVVVYVTGRHVKDVLRSLAHELVHHLQNTRGEFDVAHDTGPGYAQKDGHMRNMEKEAYLLGNLLFRDWEDQKKLQESKQMKRSKLEEMVRKVLMEKLQNEKKFPDLSGDGKITQKDILMAKGVIPKPGEKDSKDDSVKEQELDMKARASTSDFRRGALDTRDQASASGITAQERALVQQISQLLMQAAQEGNLAQGSVTRYIDMAMDKVRGMLKSGGKEELEEGGAAMRQGNEDKDQGRERMLPDRLKEEEEVDEVKTGGVSGKRGAAFGGVQDVTRKSDLDPDHEKDLKKGAKIKTPKINKMNEEEVDEVKTGGVSGKRGAAFGGVQDVTARMKKLDDEPEVEVTRSGTKITTPKINKMNEEEEIKERLNPDAQIQIHGAINDAIENLGFGYIFDEDDLDPDDDFQQLANDSQTPEEYQMKIKNYLNSKSKSYGYNGNFGDDVFKSISGQANEGNTAIAQARLAKEKGKGVETKDLGKGPADKATSRLKREYEEKFANIEATSKLHETKQQRLNKRLMEWCTK